MRRATNGTSGLDGSNPTMAEGAVNRRVCFQYTSLCNGTRDYLYNEF